MSKPKVAVLGASGFVGAALVERLFFDPHYRDRFELTAFIHGHGGAARVARLPVNIQTIDLMDYDHVLGSLATSDYVVNCTRGGSLLMIDGLKNLARALKKLGAKRFVHLSSVAIYGEDPPPESASEEARSSAAPSAYGRMKAEQDEIVFKLHRGGVPSIILCPSNISGPYSALIIDAIKRLLAHEIVLVEGGENPNNIVHVDNLVQAILAALESDTGWGERYFVNETDPVTWKRFFEDLVAMMGIDYEFSTVSREDVLPHLEAKDGRESPGVGGQLRILVSKDFREAIKIDPDHEFARRNIGVVLRKLGQHDEAILH